ncbi:glycosyl transferase family 2 [Pseudomonas sp. Ost2]|uniref:glycosyltransferase family 2 protein n=1 Tax=Pseudomonas TaxID=286 RepID=UPI001BF08C40|nr:MULTISPECIES: glycosyltransferase family 2 protein [Pseudomonas]BBP78110.1 glycosyl transferase family 2 [Pseudomonas sp. Ost2]
MKVSILMCTYNGQRFLAEQINSFERQSHSNWSLAVSDDGSHDATLEIIQDCASSWPVERLKVFSGPRQGFVANFLSLTFRPEVQADFYAWSDQDDIWNEDKLETALMWLQDVPSHVPALYCGRTQLISELGIGAGQSPRFCRPPKFANALVQSIGGGNTMVFNHAARELLREAGSHISIPSHDWWAYQLVSGAEGGVVFYDPQPKTLYRQHKANLVGSNAGWWARLYRVRMLVHGRFHEWNRQNIRALELMSHRLNKESVEVLSSFKSAREQPLFHRLAGIRRSGVYRQTLGGNLGLMFATLIRKV